MAKSIVYYENAKIRHGSKRHGFTPWHKPNATGNVALDTMNRTVFWESSLGRERVELKNADLSEATETNGLWDDALNLKNSENGYNLKVNRLDNMAFADIPGLGTVHHGDWMTCTGMFPVGLYKVVGIRPIYNSDNETTGELMITLDGMRGPENYINTNFSKSWKIGK